MGLGPVFFPAQRSFHHGPVHTQPLPVDPFSLIKLRQSCLPEFEEDSRLHPFLKAIVRRRMCTELGLVQGLPLTAGSQHVEDRVGTVSIRHARPSSPKAMAIHVDGEQRLQLRPQFIGDAEPRRGAIIGSALSFSFFGFLSVHPSYFTTFSGYSDRLLGELIVLQAERCARSEQNEHKYGETCPGLPRDIINFQHDPLACAIASGWQEGVEIETVPLKMEIRESWLYEIPDSEGIPTRLVTKIDGNAFNEFWCNILC